MEAGPASPTLTSEVRRDARSQLVAPGPSLLQHAADLSDQEGNDEHDAARRLRSTGHKVTLPWLRGSLNTP